jgi:hypothetical protein
VRRKVVGRSKENRARHRNVDKKYERRDGRLASSSDGRSEAHKLKRRIGAAVDCL